MSLNPAPPPSSPGPILRGARISGGLMEPSEPTTVMCPECQTLIEVKDIRAVLLAMHLSNDCTLSNLLVHRAE